MHKLISWMENSMAPKMNRMNNNVWVQTLKDSMMQILPMILVGSLITILAILQDFFPNMPNLWTVSNYTMGLIGALVAFVVPFNYMERKKLHKMRLVAGMASLAMYFIILRMDDPEVFDFSMLGATGMFAAIIVGIIAGLVFLGFSKFSFFKEDSAMPDFVQQWFDSMLPVTVLVFATWLTVYIFNVDIFALINLLFSPLTNFAESLPGFVLLYFIPCLFYSMGISSWMLYPVTGPIMYAGIAANIALAAQGLAPTYVNTNEVIFLGWIALGGIGATFPLVVMMTLSKAKRLKAIGRVSLVPGILQINEPVVFGAIAWNPVMMLPMWIHGLIAPTVVWLWLKAGLATIPSAVFGMWYIPHPISTWIVSPGVGGLILYAICMAIAAVTYYPFFKVYEKQQLAMETAAEAE